MLPLPYSQAHISLTLEAINALQNCLLQFQKYPRMTKEDFAKCDYKHTPAEIRRESFSELKYNAERLVAIIRMRQWNVVLEVIDREYPDIAAEFRRTGVKLDMLPDRLQSRLLGASFTPEQFVPVYVDYPPEHTSSVYDLTPKWTEWAKEQGLHPAYPKRTEGLRDKRKAKAGELRGADWRTEMLDDIEKSGRREWYTLSGLAEHFDVPQDKQATFKIGIRSLAAKHKDIRRENHTLHKGTLTHEYCLGSAELRNHNPALRGAGTRGERIYARLSIQNSRGVRTALEER